MFVSLGVLCVALGAVGVVVPGVPATEFFLAASYLFARSSPRLERRLERNRWLGPALRRFRETRGMPARAKAVSLLSMWTGVAISSYALAAAGTWIQPLVLVMGGIGTLTILFFVRTTTARQPLILS
jgi:uncharacterized membrane protein YbaN (DUF454 family)